MPSTERPVAWDRSGMTPDEARTAAELLDLAHRERRTLDLGDLGIPDLRAAYAVQDALTTLRLSRGDAVVGWKLGYTTRAMRDQMGIDAPNLGPLLASMRVEHDGAVPALTHPRVEPEIAWVMAADPGPDPSVDDVLDTVAEARLALEVVDSVWAGYRFDLEHNTADGSSAAGFVLGPVLPDADRVEVELAAPAGPAVVGTGSRRDAAASTAWLCRELAARGRALRPGDVVLTGGLTAAQALGPGDRLEARLAGTDLRVGVRR